MLYSIWSPGPSRKMAVTEQLISYRYQSESAENRVLPGPSKVLNHRSVGEWYSLIIEIEMGRRPFPR
jgi:hypothetical protein